MEQLAAVMVGAGVTLVLLGYSVLAGAAFIFAGFLMLLPLAR